MTDMVRIKNGAEVKEMVTIAKKSFARSMLTERLNQKDSNVKNVLII